MNDSHLNKEDMEGFQAAGAACENAWPRLLGLWVGNCSWHVQTERQGQRYTREVGPTHEGSSILTMTEVGFYPEDDGEPVTDFLKQSWLI